MNVEDERSDDESMLTLYRRLLDLRRSEPALSVGDWHDRGRNDRAIAYLRTDGNGRFLVAANLTSSPAQVPVAARASAGKIVLSTTDFHAAGDFDPTAGLQPNEAIVVLLD